MGQVFPWSWCLNRRHNLVNLCHLLRLMIYSLPEEILAESDHWRTVFARHQTKTTLPRNSRVRSLKSLLRMRDYEWVRWGTKDRRSLKLSFGWITLCLNKLGLNNSSLYIQALFELCALFISFAISVKLFYETAWRQLPYWRGCEAGSINSFTAYFFFNFSAGI